MIATQPTSAVASPCVLPMVENRVPAGFPSPAQDYLEGQIDLSGYLIPNPSATFIMQVEGHSMQGAGIMDGDLVVIDRSQEAINGKIVIACQGGEFTIKRLRRDRHGAWWLFPDNPEFKPMRCTEDCEIWGVVVSSVRVY